MVGGAHAEATTKATAAMALVFPIPAGRLTFLDPRGGRMGPAPLDLFEVRQELRPKDGLLLFFPAWLQHHVHPYAGSRPPGVGELQPQPRLRGGGALQTGLKRAR